MSETKAASGGLTRRSFLKTTGVAAGALAVSGALVGCSGQDAAVSQSGGERIKVPTTCKGNCHGFACPVDVFVEDGKVVDIQNFVSPEHPDYRVVCSKGYTNIERMYAPERLKHPMRRVGERGAGEWEQISWEEAIDEICTKWKELQAEYGDASVVFSAGSGAPGMSMPYTAYFERLRRYLGATNLVHNYDANGVNSTTKHIGNDPMCAIGNELRNLKYANKIFCWGCNPSESAPISYHFITEAQQQGSKLIVIDPTFTTTASKADLYVPIRPGTDGLLAIAMMNIIIRDGKQDEVILKTKTVAPFLVKASDGKYLRLSDLGRATAGSTDDAILVMSESGEVVPEKQDANPVLQGTFDVQGYQVTTAYSMLLERLKEYSIGEAVELTDIPEDVIEQLAKEFVDGPTSILTGYGIDHYSNGITGYMGMLTLLDIAGMQTKLGTGMSLCDLSLPTSQGMTAAAMSTPKDATKPNMTIPGAYVYDAVINGGIGKFNQPLKSALFYAHNIIGNYPDRKTWLEVFDAMDLVVVQDIWMTETCQYADIVLPVAFLWEVRDFGRPQANPYARLMEKAVEPQFEAKSDFEILTLLAQGMGLGDKFSMTNDEYLQAILDNDSARKWGITWDRLLEEGRIWAYEEDYVYGRDKFYTTTGRSEFYLENSVPEFDAGKEWDAAYRALPYWFPPNEAWHENDLYEKYPLIFTSERSKFKTHTQFTYVEMLNEIDPEPYVKMARSDAESRGIETGDTIKLFNDRGYVVIKAVINDGVRPGMLVIDHGWQGDQFIDGHYSDLSNRYVDAAIPGPAWFDCLCEAEKID